jgi:hypothetical protein
VLLAERIVAIAAMVVALRALWLGAGLTSRSYAFEQLISSQILASLGLVLCDVVWLLRLF